MANRSQAGNIEGTPATQSTSSRTGLLYPPRWLIAVALGLRLTWADAANLDQFLVSGTPHPLCGVNPDYPDPIYYMPGGPPIFALFPSCKTLANGFQVGVDPQTLSPGKQALIQLLVAMFKDGGFERMVQPIAFTHQTLTCGPPPGPRTAFPPGGPTFPLPEPPPGVRAQHYASKPMRVCTLAEIHAFLKEYDKRGAVKAFRRFVAAIDGLDVTKPSDIQKLKQAAAIAMASAGNTSFDDVSEILE